MSPCWTSEGAFLHFQLNLYGLVSNLQPQTVWVQCMPRISPKLELNLLGQSGSTNQCTAVILLLFR